MAGRAGRAGGAGRAGSRRVSDPVTWDTVRELARVLPDAEEALYWNSPAFKVRGKMFAVIPVHRSAEPDSLVLQLGFEQRDELLAADPDTYYLPDHYVDWPLILVRLTRVHRDALKDLLKGARDFMAAKRGK